MQAAGDNFFALLLPAFRGIMTFVACACGAGRGRVTVAGLGPVAFTPARAFLKDKVDLDKLVEEFEEALESNIDPFAVELNIVRAVQAPFGAAAAGPAASGSAAWSGGPREAAPTGSGSSSRS
jgi:hypothetical protein